jgi:transcriptional regulator with XRE-family HTH domain
MAANRPATRQTLARTLRLLMDKTGLSEAEVARRAAISKKSVNNLLHARHAPNLDHVDAVAGVFGLNLWHMILPNLPDELLTSKSIDELIVRYSRADARGRESIDLVAEIAADYHDKSA